MQFDFILHRQDWRTPLYQSCRLIEWLKHKDGMMTFERKIQDLNRDILRYKKACQSEWPRPIDYTNLIDAQYALRALSEDHIEIT